MKIIVVIFYSNAVYLYLTMCMFIMLQICIRDNITLINYFALFPIRVIISRNENECRFMLWQCGISILNYMYVYYSLILYTGQGAVIDEYLIVFIMLFL